MREVEESPSDMLFNQSLEKGLAVLRAFNAQRRTMTLGDVASATGISKSSAQRMVHTLEALGYVCKHPKTRRYQLTPKVMEVGYNYLAADILVDVANPFLSELANITGETVNLTEPYHCEMVYVARFVASKFIPIHMPIGSRIPMYCTASGRAYLSALSAAEAQTILMASDRVVHTPHTLTEVDDIMQALVATRERGFASNREELFLGDMTIASPIFNSERTPVASVHVVAPTSRWTLEDAEKKLGPLVLDCARAISNSVRTLV
ncbi:IclR family transcriptional regulator [Herbaspirillum rubrisubalbicans]|uniref:IclR family transcriptional regulator n=1 Tax=Herbaspirillum rubrisubalbicans TaxID=80842 RepID=A0AAD0XHG2_9BURK|nr:IclR family transcriptional regulator [Herbaspirillum rubrisubalbicans]ALU89676.1 IclR family transcription regulator protein [Herbaspirillum rubrisubalbicans M1]AYR24754.1 IclR family transcriptional regulator [Herbaspirillum rubrisubalbicans]